MRELPGGPTSVPIHNRGRLQVWRAKADVRADGIGHGAELHEHSIRCNYIDAAKYQGSHADVAIALHRQ
jgi:hypothetical protein